jgi:hypothetical protein
MIKKILTMFTKLIMINAHIIIMKPIFFNKSVIIKTLIILYSINKITIN